MKLKFPVTYYDEQIRGERPLCDWVCKMCSLSLGNGAKRANECCRTTQIRLAQEKNIELKEVSPEYMEVEVG